MKAKELIAALETMPPDANVTHLWDGEARTSIEHVWLSRGGYVVTADCEMTCYSDDTRPLTAPTEDEDPVWQTPGKSRGEVLSSDIRITRSKAKAAYLEWLCVSDEVLEEFLDRMITPKLFDAVVVPDEAENNDEMLADFIKAGNSR